MAGFPVLLIILAIVALPLTIHATDYTVGDSNGWTTGEDYSSWTSGKTFKVGDVLLFSYGPTHTVDVVNKQDYDACSTNNIINNFSGGNTRYTLNSTGTSYFICGQSNHCSQGMKLAVTVSAASTGGSTTPAGTPPTSSTPGTPNTPSTPSSPRTGGAVAMANVKDVFLVGAPLLILLVLMG